MKQEFNGSIEGGVAGRDIINVHGDLHLSGPLTIQVGASTLLASALRVMDGLARGAAVIGKNAPESIFRAGARRR